MTDHLTKEKRSWNMQQITSKNTKPELIVRSYLHRSGLRFRINVSSIPGKPDIYLRKYQTVIFVHGCFWHRHSGCKRASVPKSNQNYWESKFKRNVERDIEIKNILEQQGYKVLVVWECQTKDQKYLEQLVSAIKGESI